MSRQKAIYEVVHAETGEVLSGHRTRQAAVDSWRVRHTGMPVKIIRWPRRSDGPGVLIVEGTWHESRRPDAADPTD
ncbi:MAG: hypothetical protein ACRD03_14250 [Acidimicrobiales bacterium]